MYTEIYGLKWLHLTLQLLVEDIHLDADREEFPEILFDKM